MRRHSCAQTQANTALSSTGIHVWLWSGMLFNTHFESDMTPLCFACQIPLFCYAYGLHCASNNVFSLLRMKRGRQKQHSDSSLYLDRGDQGVGRNGRPQASESDIEMKPTSMIIGNKHGSATSKMSNQAQFRLISTT